MPEVVSGMEGLIRCASLKNCDTVVVSVVGMIGIRPTIAAIRAGKHIALANKETLVTAGHIIMPMVKAYGVKLMPVDSEHSAIYQCLTGEDHDGIDKILLTASGGPFRGYTKDQIKNVTAADALKHPNWSMGAKITIDSASMMNKGLELIEAAWLFDMKPENIDVVVHRESIVHSMIEFCDKAKFALSVTPVAVRAENKAFALLFRGKVIALKSLPSVVNDGIFPELRPVHPRKSRVLAVSRGRAFLFSHIVYHSGKPCISVKNLVKGKHTQSRMKCRKYAARYCKPFYFHAFSPSASVT